MISWKKQTLLFLLSLALAGCSLGRVGVATLPPSTETLPSAPALPSATPIDATKSPTPRPLVPTLTDTPTPTKLDDTSTIPTSLYPYVPSHMNPTQVQKMAELLQMKECELPCYLGIIPGETLWEEARAILADLGAWSFVETYKPTDFDFAEENGWPIYTYDLVIGDPTRPLVTPSELDLNSLIFQQVEVTVGDGKVERLQIYLPTYSTLEFGEAYQSGWWARYTLGEVIRWLGKPDTIYFEPIPQEYPFYTIELVYEDVGAVIEYRGLRKDYHAASICPFLPSEEGKAIFLDMVLTDSKSPLRIYPPGQIPLIDRPEIYKPIETVLGISPAEFVSHLLANPSACFEIKEQKSRGY